MHAFERSIEDTVITWKEIYSVKDPILLWKNLSENGILTLRKKEELRDSIGNKLDLTIMDGVAYRFQLHNTKGNRMYFYHCPRIWAEDFPKVPEFKKVVNMINLIYEFFDPEFKFICRYKLCHSETLIT